MKTFHNPILKGFYPDPSICRVKDDYYLVTSSFSYFPGIPVFHSKDLVHWEQLGHVISRPGQLDYAQSAHSEGLFAPTIRYFNGIFYVVCTMVSNGREGNRENFICTASDPAGPWSDPVIIQGALGIDPSLYFAQDGTPWLCGSRIPEKRLYFTHREIYLCSLDSHTFQIAGQTKIIWDGAQTRGHWVEAPHIYRIGEWYYLIIAEGGTYQNHCVMMARSKSIDGDYEFCPRNPVITHRHLALNHSISVVGHGDLVETRQNQWYLVLLGIRPYGNGDYNLGRETFLAPIVWEKDQWPRIDDCAGLVQETMAAPDLPAAETAAPPTRDDFDKPELCLIWNQIRANRTDFYKLQNGCLRLFLSEESIDTPYATPSFIARRLQDHQFQAAACMSFQPKGDGLEAGLCMLQNHNFYYLFTVVRKQGKCYLQLKSHRLEGKLVNHDHYGEDAKRVEKILKVLPLPDVLDKLVLSVACDGNHYRFSYGFHEEPLNPFVHQADMTLLSSQQAGGFVGAYLGMYASANGQKSDGFVDFDWFEYEGNTDNEF